jgi:hypothetical protein
MATTTPNYGWTVPTSSDLVKNGATAIETLGDSVDASLWSSGYGQAGKNKVINGDFNINQRSFSTTSTDTAYTFDRWQVRQDTGTVSATAQAFTPGTAPVAGYEAKNYISLSGSGQTVAGAQLALQQSIESVRTFAGQTATVSFWAKAASGTPKIALQLQQIFGTGGSTTVNTYGGQVTLSTSWARYSLTVSVPSVSGKTISSSNDDKLTVKLYCSAGTNFDAVTGSLGIQSGTFDFWGVQVEAGLLPSPFQTASGGSKQAELAMCQRYYYRITNGSAYQILGIGSARSTTAADVVVPFPVTMRTAPSTLDFSTLAFYAGNVSVGATSASGFLLNTSNTSTNSAWVYGTVSSGLTTSQITFLTTNNSSTGYIGFGAEL